MCRVYGPGAVPSAIDGIYVLMFFRDNDNPCNTAIDSHVALTRVEMSNNDKEVQQGRGLSVGFMFEVRIGGWGEGGGGVGGGGRRGGGGLRSKAGGRSARVWDHLQPTTIYSVERSESLASQDMSKCSCQKCAGIICRPVFLQTRFFGGGGGALPLAPPTPSTTACYLKAVHCRQYYQYAWI